LKTANLQILSDGSQSHMKNKIAELIRLTEEAQSLSYAARVLEWDQQVFMPPGGGPARGRQMALLSRLYQEKATDPAIGRLLDELQPYAESLPFDDEDAALIRAARRNFERDSHVPPAFAAAFSEHSSATFQAWAEARPANDFNKVRPYLEKTLEYSRQMANFFPGYEHIADPLINFSDYGMKAADIRRVFSELRGQLVPLIQQIRSQPPIDDACLHLTYAKEAQLRFGDKVVRDLGYDFNRGRMDLTHHPFTTSFSIGDVRITTRVRENYLGECMFSIFHEGGHAMHAQGCNPAYEGTPLVGWVSSGVAESQSRTWENIVGRSRDFWEHYYPLLQADFPEQLKQVSLDTFYRAINKVQPSLIRTDADEVTYNLHPMLRFDLELALLEGSLSIKDLPEAWNERYRSDLGITPPDMSSGVMQDVHWFSGPIGGAFEGYTLGNILSAMFYEEALRQHPGIPAEMRQGQFATLHNWLIENIYQYGAKYTTSEIIRRITGRDLDVQPLMRYFKRKYGEIYSL
jgi:carboxypeptidase Taq